MYAVYSFNLAVMFIGVLLQISVLVTQSTRMKNYADISYMNGMCVLVLSLINAMVFSLTVLLMGDFCGLSRGILQDNLAKKFDALMP